MTKSFWRGKRVLITGHTGFKGSWLALWLMTLESEVWGYALIPKGDPSLFNDLQLETISGRQHWGNLHNHQGDIRDFDNLSQYVQAVQPEVVFHLAAQPLVRQSYNDPLDTWSTNVQGSLNLLEALKHLQHRCPVVMVTTDKVYSNREWEYGYREDDRLGGHDPYSASKAAAELAIASWRSSFCGSAINQTPHLAIATARAGNVIGGGDWSEDRIIPDAMRALSAGQTIPVRSPNATRPWQHVLEPLSGYLRLAEYLSTSGETFTTTFNFGPTLDSNRQVTELLEEILQHWPGVWKDFSDPSSPHEAGRLHLQIDRAYHQLTWRPRWDFPTTIARTVIWYRSVHQGANPLECCLSDLDTYQRKITYVS